MRHRCASVARGACSRGASGSALLLLLLSALPGRVPSTPPGYYYPQGATQGAFRIDPWLPPPKRVSPRTEG